MECLILKSVMPIDKNRLHHRDLPNLNVQYNDNNIFFLLRFLGVYLQTKSLYTWEAHYICHPPRYMFGVSCNILN